MATRVLIIGFIWPVVAVWLGVTGLVAALRPPAPQLILAGLTAALLLAFCRSSAFRSWVMGLPLQALLLPHAVRLVGIYFLVLRARGELPYAFAVPGGWGDIAVAATGLILAFVPREKRWRGKAYLAWNTFGLTDILFVIGTAARLAMADSDSMNALLRFPLSLLPTFFLPLIVASHGMLFVRLSDRNQ